MHNRDDGNFAGRLVERLGEASCLIDAATGETISSRDLSRLIVGFAAGFLSAGLQPGDRLLLGCGISPASTLSYLGAMYAGIVPVPTEERLLAMSDADYMNSEQLAFFRHRLQQMERELLSNADETTEHLRETVIVPDPADRATIEEEHALELRTRDRERKLLKKVQSSLALIEAGEYGFCEETGDPIGIPRLLARPTATLSLEAQQRREIKQKLFGD